MKLNPQKNTDMELLFKTPVIEVWQQSLFVSRLTQFHVTESEPRTLSDLQDSKHQQDRRRPALTSVCLERDMKEAHHELCSESPEKRLKRD